MPQIRQRYRKSQGISEDMGRRQAICRSEEVRAKLEIQESDARWWRDACVQYFGEFSGMAVPEEVAGPERPLDELKKIKLDMTHHN